MEGILRDSETGRDSGNRGSGQHAKKEAARSGNPVVQETFFFGNSAIRETPRFGKPRVLGNHAVQKTARSRKLGGVGGWDWGRRGGDPLLPGSGMTSF